MSREKIANFLNAERKVSPLMAFSLLITAGFIAGSLQLVAPQNQNAMTAQAAGSSSGLDSQAPDNCTDAIKAALGKQMGPPATTVDQGQSGTADACFGGVLADPVRGTPSQNPADYKCVGRSGKVTITSDSAITTTAPDTTVPLGRCKVQVCQPIPGIDPAGKPTVNPNCGEPKQFGAGQSVTPQSGGVPSLPSIPSGSSGAGSAPSPSYPTPNSTTNLPNADPFPFEETAQPNTPNNSTRLDDLANQPGADPFPFEESKTNPNGAATVPSGESSTLGSDPYYGENAQSGQYPDRGIDPGVDQSGINDFCLQNPTGCVGADGKPTFGEPTQLGVDAGINDIDTPTKSGAVTNPWLNGDNKPESSTGMDPNELTPALEPSVRDLAGPRSANTWDPNGVYPGTDQPGVKENGIVPGTDQPGVKETGVAPGSDQPGVNDYCKNNPGACVDANGKPNTPGVYPGTDQPGVDDVCKKNPSACANGRPAAPTGVIPGTDQPGVSEVCKQNPSKCVQVPSGGGGNTSGGTGGAGGGGGGSGAGSGGSSNTAMRGLQSFLTGLARGMSGMLGAGMQQQGQTCPTDPQAYQQYQQQYNYQLQQYNYQLQQYNYQQQQYNYQQQYNMQYGYSNSAMPPQPPVPCRPGNGSGTGTGGTNGTGVGGVCQPLSSQPDPAACPTGAWRPMTTSLSNGSVCPVWQCVAASSSVPTAQLTCDPGVVENGTKVNISYTCTNSKSSTGFGFVTNGSTSGATSTIINAPEGATAANFTLRCENGQVTAGAQCSVQVAKVSISLRHVPEKVVEGEPALIGWVTTGMDSCTISSPDQPEFTARNASITKVAGIATSSPITGKTDFYLNCKTVTGGFREEKISLEPYRPGTVSSSIENRVDLVRGSSARIQWSFPSAPDVSAVALWLYNMEDKRTVALISGHHAKTGSLTWDIPEADSPCNTTSSLVCGSDLVPGRTYQIVASLYTPVNASLGEFNDPSLPEPRFLDNPATKTFRFAQ